MNFNNITYLVTDGICTITINRPSKLNALNIETISELGRAFAEAEASKEVTGIILTGEGPKAFAAGADIAEFANFSVEEARIMSASGHDTFDQIENCSKPVIAAVNGFSLGGGCELAMSCHMRIASNNAKFGQPEVNLGLIPGYGGTQRLTRLIGKSKATELLLTGDNINAEQALAYGIINHITEPDQLLEKATEILSKIAQKSPLAVAQILKLVNTYYDKDINGFTEEITEFSECFDTQDFKEGVQAFLEKRKASFSGR